MPDRNDQSPDFALPDFSGKGAGQGTGRSGAGAPSPGSTSGGSAPGTAPGRPGSGGAPGPGGTPRRGLWIALGIGGVVILLVVALVLVLVLNRTVLSGDPDPAAGPDPTTVQEAPSDSESPRGEYIPTEEETPAPEPPEGPTMTVAPSTECTMFPGGSEQEQPPGEIRGGGLSIPVPDSWQLLLGSNGGDQPHMEDSTSAWTPVEDGWYTTVTVGRVSYPDEAGGYPGAEAAARHLFECSITRDDSSEVFGDEPQASGISEEAITVDGHPAHRFEATVAITGDVDFESTDSWKYVAIVVDTPGGPSAFIGGAATGHDDQMADLDAMTGGLAVTE